MRRAFGLPAAAGAVTAFALAFSGIVVAPATAVADPADPPALELTDVTPGTMDTGQEILEPEASEALEPESTEGANLSESGEPTAEQPAAPADHDSESEDAEQTPQQFGAETSATASAAQSAETPQPDANEIGSVSPFSGAFTRLAGANRYSTSIKISQRYEAGVPAVFISTGANFPDALSAAAAAAGLGAPLILSAPEGLSGATVSEIKRLRPKAVYIVGGTGAVSKKVEQQATAAAGVKASRVEGGNRYSTSQRLVDRFFTRADFAVIATGSGFADALAASGVAGAKQAPVILVDGAKGSVPASVISQLTKLGTKTVLIAGGAGAVSVGIENQLKNAGLRVDRKGGADRYATAALINAAYFPSGSADIAFIATGASFPDALSGAALAGRIGAPLYTTTPTCMPSAVADAVGALSPKQRVVFGGTGAVGDSSAKGTKCVAPKPKPTPKPQRAAPNYDGSCPAGYPIKGNHSRYGDWIYHVPGGQYYNATDPEECFANEAAARAAGYRASKR